MRPEQNSTPIHHLKKSIIGHCQAVTWIGYWQTVIQSLQMWVFIKDDQSAWIYPEVVVLFVYNSQNLMEFRNFRAIEN